MRPYRSDYVAYTTGDRNIRQPPFLFSFAEYRAALLRGALFLNLYLRVIKNYGIMKIRK